MENNSLNNTQKLEIRNKNKIRYIPYSRIIFLEAKNQYTKIIHDSGEEIIAKCLTEIGNMLPDFFLRIHRSYIVNKNYIEKADKAKRYLTLFVKNDVKLKTSVRKKSEILKAI